MSRVATWRRGPGDPDTVRGWLFRFGTDPVAGEPPPNPNPNRRWAIAAGLIAYLSVAGTAIVFVPKYGGAIAILLQLPFQFFSMARAIKRKALTIPILEPGETFDVRMTVGTHAGATGSDRGWLIFSEGWLLFEGARTSFALTRGEARILPSQPMTLKVEDRRTVGFILPGERPDAGPLNRALQRWNAGPIPEGEAILPPVEIHPTVWVDRCSVSALGAVVMTVPTVLATFYAYWIVAGLAGIVLVVCLALMAIYVRKTEKSIRAVAPHQTAFEAFLGRPSLLPPALPEGP